MSSLASKKILIEICIFNLVARSFI